MRRKQAVAMQEPLVDAILLRGAIEYALKDARTGEVIERGFNKNTVVTVGRAYILNRIGSTDANVIDRIYLGTSTTAPATSQAALVGSFASKSAGTVSNAGTTANPPYYTFAASWASNETHASSSVINEFGLFAANGTMIGRVTTSATINFASTNTLAVTYTLSN